QNIKREGLITGVFSSLLVSNFGVTRTTLGRAIVCNWNAMPAAEAWPATAVATAPIRAAVVSWVFVMVVLPSWGPPRDPMARNLPAIVLAICDSHHAMRAGHLPRTSDIDLRTPRE